MNSGLVLFDAARLALSQARTIDEVKRVRDKAEALRLYARQVGESLGMQNDIAEIKVRAERRAGELLAEQDKNPGGNPNLFHDGRSCVPTLADIGISPQQSMRWQRLARLQEGVFEQHIAEVKSTPDGELTSVGLDRLARRERQREGIGQTQVSAPLAGHYATLVVDPPWPIEKLLRDVRPNQVEFDYPTMTVEEIKSDLAIPGAAANEAHLYLWATQRFLPTAFEVMVAWGFAYIFTMVWHKSGGFQPFGLPQYNCEFVLFGRKGGLSFLDTKAFSVCFSGARREHSRKPLTFYELVSRVSPGPRLDCYSREAHEGFEVWGNEIDKF